MEISLSEYFNALTPNVQMIFFLSIALVVYDYLRTSEKVAIFELKIFSVANMIIAGFGKKQNYEDYYIAVYWVMFIAGFIYDLIEIRQNSNK